MEFEYAVLEKLKKTFAILSAHRVNVTKGKVENCEYSFVFEL